MAKLCMEFTRRTYKPLEDIVLRMSSGEEPVEIIIRDGEGQEYFKAAGEPVITFKAQGALGSHRVSLQNAQGEEQDSLSFRVDCETEIKEDTGIYEELLTMLHYTMIHWNEASNCLYNGRIYKYFVGWLRDHVHTLKGMKYFYPDLKSALELYRDSQREDGMIWDNVNTRRETKRSFWEQRFEYDHFVRVSEDKKIEFRRIPVENDVEYLYIEGIYYTWKATGDDQWMAGMLNSAIKAYHYSQTDPYRWSEKYQLLKRGFTIDTWDFQADEDAAIADGDIMKVYKDKTRFGVMHGDNTGFATGCFYLAEMLEQVNREEEAGHYRQLGNEIKERLDALAWNGQFYTHHIPEDETVIRDLGVDQSKQLSLSNAYALNRCLTLEQRASIIKKYMDIRDQLPQGSPGEWYTIYPPFERGFEGHSDKWEYMNGGVITIAAGELARGAMENGFEEYGADILRRVHNLAKRHDGYLDCCFKGAVEQPPKAQFTTLDISQIANEEESIPGWTVDAPEEFNVISGGQHVLEGIPFAVPRPEESGGRVCISLSHGRQGEAEKRIPLGQKAKSIYFLHTMTGHDIAGEMTLQYSDGTSYTQYMHHGQEILNWWMPEEPAANRSRHKKLVVGWEGKNPMCSRVGLTIYGLNNPYPEKEIRELVLSGARNGCVWSVQGITLSDSPVYFEPSDVSFGIPDNWGAAAVVYGLIEGLAGVIDKGTAMGRIRFSPRWVSGDVKESTAAVKYPASNGYVAYQYSHKQEERVLKIQVTGNAREMDCHILLPKGAEKAVKVQVNGRETDWAMTRVQESNYVDFMLPLKGAADICIQYM